MNTRITYSYADSDNYKKNHSTVVDGPLSEEQIKEMMESRLDGEYFIPSHVGLTDLQGDDPFVDHQWHRIEEDDFEETTDQPTESLTAAQLFSNFCKAKW